MQHNTPRQYGDHLYQMRRLPSQMPSALTFPNISGKCPDCHDTGTMTVTLWGVRDGDRYEQADEPCRCPLGQAVPA
jgi:hypothetical protein